MAHRHQVRRNLPDDELIHFLMIYERLVYISDHLVHQPIFNREGYQFVTNAELVVANIIQIGLNPFDPDETEEMLELIVILEDYFNGAQRMLIEFYGN